MKPIKFACKGCDKILVVTDEDLAGLRIRCPKCEEVCRVPAKRSNRRAAVEIDSDDEIDVDDAPTKSKGGIDGTSVFFLVLLLAYVSVVGLQYFEIINVEAFLPQEYTTHGLDYK